MWSVFRRSFWVTINLICIFDTLFLMESGTRDVYGEFVELLDRLVIMRSKQMQKCYLGGLWYVHFICISSDHI